MAYKELVLSVYPEAEFKLDRGDGFYDLWSSKNGPKRLLYFENTFHNFGFKNLEKIEKQLWKQAWFKIQRELERKLSA